MLAANNTPDFRTISDFRKDHLKALSGLFLPVFKLYQKVGLVKLGHISPDGTKIKANTSRCKAMIYQRMKEEEARPEAEIKEMPQKEGHPICLITAITFPWISTLSGLAYVGCIRSFAGWRRIRPDSR